MKNVKIDFDVNSNTKFGYSIYNNWFQIVSNSQMIQKGMKNDTFFFLSVLG